MEYPLIHRYSHSKGWMNDKMPQTGDTVYYISPSVDYYVRKSTVVGIKQIRAFRFLEDWELTLADGTVINYDETFESKEKALEYIIDRIKYDIASKRAYIQSTLMEIEKYERVLARLEEKNDTDNE